MQTRMKLVILALALTLAGMQVQSALAQPSVGAVLNGASYSASLAPGCWAVIFGTDLAASTAGAVSVPLPTTLGDTSVTVGGIPAPLLYVSSNQINVLIPFEVDASTPRTAVIVTTAARSSVPYTIPLDRHAPAIFTTNAQGTGPAILLDTGFHLIDTVAPQDVVIVYAAGLGPTDPPASSASGAPADGPLSWVVDAFDIYIGDQKLDSSDVLFDGLAPGFPGIYQLNLRVPAGLATDRIYIRQGGWQSNVVQAGVAAGQNVTNVSGSITGIFPPTSPGAPPYNITPIGSYDLPVELQAVAFSVSFQILPSAQPFVVAAVGEAGSSIITIDPVSGTYHAIATEPSAQSRAGDFSQSEFPVLYDWATCQPDTGLCLPFPNNVLPASRLYPDQMQALNWLPLPNTPVAGSSVFLRQAGGTATAGSTFTIDPSDTASSTSAMGLFGGWVYLPWGPFDTHDSTLELFVDGQQIASTKVTYSLARR